MWSLEHLSLKEAIAMGSLWSTDIQRYTSSSVDVPSGLLKYYCRPPNQARVINRSFHYSLISSTCNFGSCVARMR
jgi:hypothetical protein